MRPTQSPQRAAAQAADTLALERDLAALPELDLAELRARWQDLTGKPAPDGLWRDLLIRAIAYELQARVLGGLDRKTAQELDRIARGLREGIRPSFRPERRLRAGTELLREWQGRVHRVTVLEDGFGWNGQTHASLSEIARTITGTQWNGPRFFGLREGRGE
jgi:hypothetical protein